MAGADRKRKSSNTRKVNLETRQVDQRRRLILPRDFANQTIIIERIGANELRVRKKPTLSQLLAGVTQQNLHAEVDTGPAVGSEAL